MIILYFLLFIGIIVLAAVVGTVANVLAGVLAIRRRLRRKKKSTPPQQAQTRSDYSAHTRRGSNHGKIIPPDEGEYVDYEEVN